MRHAQADVDRIEFDIASLPSSIEFGGSTYEADDGKALVLGTMCHSFPSRNSAGRSWTAATLANSFRTAIGQGANVEHKLRHYARYGFGTNSDEYRGTILAVEFPDKKTAMDSEKAGNPVPLKVLVAVWKKAQGSMEMLADIAQNNVWKFSMECESLIKDRALWDGEKFHLWKDCPNEMRALVEVDKVNDWNGKQITLCLGGIDGTVTFSGVAFTKHPRDDEAKIDRLAANQDEVAARAWDTEDAPDRYFAYVPAEAKGPGGKKSLRKFPLASVEKKDYDPAILRNALARFSQAKLPASAKAGVRAKILSAIRSWNSAHPKDKINVSDTAAELVAGFSSISEDGHYHALLKDLTCLSSGTPEHVHSARVLDVGPPLEGLLTTAYLVVPGQPASTLEHNHIFRLGDATVAHEPRNGGSKGEGGGEMNWKELAAVLRKIAAELQDSNPEAAKHVSDQADLVEKSSASQDVAAQVAAQVEAKLKGGEYVAKAEHESAVAAAKAAGRAEAEAAAKELAVKEAKAKEAMEKRLERLKTEVGVAASDELRADLAALPDGEAGERMFAAMVRVAVLAKPDANKNGLMGNAPKGGNEQLSVAGLV